MLTKTDKRKLNKCFKEPFFQLYSDNPCMGLLAGRKMFPIYDRALGKKLTEHFGLNTNDNTYLLEGYVFNFSWTIQKWYVGA